MTRNQKKIAAILCTGFIIFACCGGGVFWLGTLLSEFYTLDPTQVDRLGQEIADYRLPEGYQAYAGFDFLNNKAILIAHDAGSLPTSIFLMRAPKIDGVSETEAENQLQVIMSSLTMQYQVRDFSLERTESRPINGQDQDVVYHIGQNIAGDRFRRLSLSFTSDNYRLFFVAIGPEEDWDQKGLNQLMDSLKPKR